MKDFFTLGQLGLTQFNVSVYFAQGEGRLVRMQFDGSNKAGAVKECSSAVEKLKEYLPVSTQDDAPPPHNQPPTEIAAAVIQVAHFTIQ